MSEEQQQGFLSALLESVEDGIVACDARGIITVFNHAARKFHGLDEAPIQPERWAEYYDLYLPDGRTLMKTEEVPLYRALRGEIVRNVEMVIAPKNGVRRTLLASGRAIYGTGGEKLGAVVVMRDFTELKATHEALQHESRLIEALMDNIPDAVYFKDTEGRFTRVNRHAPYRNNSSPADVVGKTDFDFFVEEHARAAREDELRIITTGRPIVDKEEREVYPDGSFTWLSTTKVPIFDEAGRVTGIAGISRDITERKLAEEARLALVREQAARAEAEAAGRLKDEFLSTLSHELRTPLTAILGWAKLLCGGLVEDEARASAAEIIARSAETQARLIDDLLDVSRIVTGKLSLDLQPTPLAPVVEAAVNTIRPAAEAKEISLRASLDPEAGQVSGDPVRLQQVVWNLLSNAVKFTPRGGRVEVSLMRRGAQVEIVVTDTGAGIGPEFLPHVFESFRQADQSTTRKYGGLGLGLAIVRHLVEAHGGTVRVESEGEGRGATFAVSLPLVSARVEEAPARRGNAAATRPERLDGLKVLVVDDEADTRELLRVGLGQYGAEVVTAGSAREALAAVERERPAVLVSDIGMPGEDGYDLIREVRALDARGGEELPAIALTAYARAEDRQRALAAGYQFHIPKPVEMSELASAVASLMKVTDEAG
jgi:PAS domain S-box-containing protein